MGIHRKFTGTLTRAAATASSSEIVTGVGGKAVIIIFSAIVDADANTSSDGWDDANIVGSLRTASLTLLATLLSTCTKSHTKSVHIQTINGDGHSANVASLDSDGFTLNWTKIGNGQAITVKYIAIL